MHLILGNSFRALARDDQILNFEEGSSFFGSKFDEETALTTRKSRRSFGFALVRDFLGSL